MLKRIICIVLVVFSSLSIVAGPTAETSNANTDYKRVVVIAGPGALRMVKVLNIEELVIAIDWTGNASPSLYGDLVDLPVVTNMNGDVSYEDIISLQPDVVIASYWQDENLEKLLEPEIDVYRIDIGKYAGYNEQVLDFARLFDKEERALEYLSWIHEYEAEVASRLEVIEEDSFRLFQFYGGEWGYSEGPPFGSYGRENFWVTPIFEKLKLHSISRDLPGDWITVDTEWVIMQNPEIIIREVFGSILGAENVGIEAVNQDLFVDMYKSLTVNSFFTSSDAVKQNRVIVMDGSLMQTEWFIGYGYLAKLIYPEIFEDLDPQAYHQEYLSRFLNTEVDLSAQGTFFYTEK